MGALAVSAVSVTAILAALMPGPARSEKSRGPTCRITGRCSGGGQRGPVIGGNGEGCRRGEQSPSVVQGHAKLTLTLEVPCALAERLSAQAIREGKNLEAVVIERLGEADSPAGMKR